MIQKRGQAVCLRLHSITAKILAICFSLTATGALCTVVQVVLCIRVPAHSCDSLAKSTPRLGTESEDWDSFSNFHNDASACQATCLRVASVQKRCHSLMCPKVPHGSCSYKSCLPTSLPIRAISAHIHYNINILLHMPSLNFLYWVEMSLSHLHVPSAQHRIWKE